MTARFASEGWPEAEGAWSFERTLIAEATQPSFQLVGGALHFSATGLRMSVGERLQMRLLDARWSLSPQRGREHWSTIQAEVSHVQLCGGLYVAGSA